MLPEGWTFLGEPEFYTPLAEAEPLAAGDYFEWGLNAFTSIAAGSPMIGQPIAAQAAKLYTGYSLRWPRVYRKVTHAD